MLSIRGRALGSADYYFGGDTAEGYYRTDAQASEWLGRGSKVLGVDGEVREDLCRSLMAGFAADGTPLVQNAGSKTRQAGWDLTFSLPKSAGVLWAVGGDAQREGIDAAHRAAVRAAVEYLEDEAAFSRVGHGGVGRERAGLVVAGFHHSTSRLLDPQPHTHCLVINVCTRDDGSTGTVLSKPFYESKMAAGAVYQAKLGAELERLGYRTEATRRADGSPLGTVEVVGVPKAVTEFFSQRRQEIETATRAGDRTSAAAAEVAALDTRRKKPDAPPWPDLFRSWQDAAERLGFTRTDAEKLTNPSRQVADEFKVVRGAVEAAKTSLTGTASAFTERDLFRATLVRTLGHGVTPEVVKDAVRHHLASSTDIVSLGGARDFQFFTTQAVWRTEKQLLASATALHEREVKGLRERTVREHVEKPYRPDPVKPAFTLKPEQAEAVRHLTAAGGSLRTLSGYAGTGKTAVLRAVREAFEKDGFTVLGAAFTGAAAEQLEKGSGITSDTLAMRFIQMDRSAGDLVRHHGKQLVREAFGLPSFKPQPKLVIDKKTVLVVDEAGMLGTNDLAKLAAKVEAGGGRVILVGDHRQLPPIQAGGGFRALAERFGHHELTDITRQASAWGRAKAKDLAHGEAETVLRSFAAKGLLTVGADREAAVSRMVADWAKGGTARPDQHVMLAVTNADVRRLNELAQRARREAGEVRGAGTTVAGHTIHDGDRVVFRENSRSLGVKNGSLGTVTAAGGSKLTVAVDGKDEPVRVNLKEYGAVQLGYALTVHKSQGATFDHTYTLLGGPGTSRETAYVVGSRERQAARLYTDRFEAGAELTWLAGGGNPPPGALDSPLARQAARSVEKRLAADAVLAEQQRQQELARQQQMTMRHTPVTLRRRLAPCPTPLQRNRPDRRPLP